MGGEFFDKRRSAATAKEAFDSLVSEALHDYGHRGYTGTIAEKRGFGFTLIDPKPGETIAETSERAYKLAYQQAKDDPAVCVDLGEKPGPDGLIGGRWCFMGWASA